MQANRFFAVLAFITMIPLFGLGFVPPLFHAQMNPHVLATLAPVIAVTGYGHVATTGYFYVDRHFTDLIAGNRTRFFALPVAAMLLSFLAYEAGNATAGMMFIAFFAWQLYHYQRQNYGVVCFAAAQKKLGPLPRTLNPMLNLSVAGGIIVMLGHRELLNLPALRPLGLTVFAAATLLLIHVVSRRRVFGDPLVLLFSVLGWAFFVPTLLSDNVVVSFTSYAVAHGAQYIMFMMIITGRGLVTSLAIMGAFMAGTYASWLAFTHIIGAPDTFNVIMLNGLVMGHFLVDAKIWKLREKPQRKIMSERFAFLALG